MARNQPEHTLATQKQPDEEKVARFDFKPTHLDVLVNSF